MPNSTRRDDRGRLCRVLTNHPFLAELALPWGHPDRRLHQLRLRFLLAGRPVDAAMSILIPGIVLSLLPLIFALGVPLAQRQPISYRQYFPWIDLSTCAAVVGIWATLIAAGHGAWRLVRYRRSGRFQRELARVHRCVACGYELEGLEPDHDGCTTCCECGASWRLGQPAGD